MENGVQVNLALKYRPENFRDLVGQDILVRILSNSFASGDLGTPLLLVGASGVGKTTCARIVALCLNCERGPTNDPCGKCDSCTSIKGMSNPDVVEMDAASNTGVDDIRVILESANYLPTSSSFRVYIIDEVHMLSTSAFNALLKTLESPAPHVKFIMATTEARKVPVTVASRCLRLDLFRLTVEQLYQHLLHVAKLEDIAADHESLRLLAENSSGSVRNALLFLEQAAVYTKNNVTVSETRTLLGIADKNVLEKVVKNIINSEVSDAIQGYRDLCMQSNAVSIFESMQQIVYELCINSVNGSIPCGLSEVLSSCGKAKSTTFLSRMWQLVLRGVQEIKGVESQEQAGEMLIIRLCYLCDLPSPKKIASYVLSQVDSGTLGMGETSAEGAGNVSFSDKDDKFAVHHEQPLVSPMVDVSSGKGDMRKKKDVNSADKLYNPEDDATVADVMKGFKGASVVGVKDLDI
ncbi:DNA polymerase III subunit gamma/tau [Anaplasma platys]|uniref:DNA polymerase III subunit gamma/tau n=1 Tax=Anaplasma platys TaxID=949 RepID=UPI001EECFA7F|nr:DNA polymerase III subunit gamma/tau [Anaplasma platys]